MRGSTRPVWRALTGAVAVPTVVLTAVVPVAAVSEPPAGTGAWRSLEQLGFAPPSAEQRDESIIRYRADGTVRSVETVEHDHGETVISLASDILFDTDQAVLTDAARAKVADLVAAVPQGASLAVHGHTDTRASAEHNQALSERRAEAVADAIRPARPDLHLEIRGFGETQLKVPEAGDDIAADRAANRRVDLRYTG